MSGFCWERHPDGPFATLIAVAATYCSPDAYDGAYADLIADDQPGPFEADIGSFGCTGRRRTYDRIMTGT